MPARPSTLRVAATLMAVLGATGAVAFGLAALARPWLAGVLPPSPLGIGVLTVVLTVCLAVLQLRFVRRELLTEVGAMGLDSEQSAKTAVSDATRQDVQRRLTRLASAADAPAPTLRLVESSVPNSLSVAGSRAGTIVLSTALLAQLDGEGLDAVLAHELAHLQNRDAAVLTLASFLPALVSGEYSPIADLGLDRLSPTGQWTLGAVAVAVGYVVAFPSLPGGFFSLASLATYAVGIGLSTLLGGVLLGLAATPTVYLTRELAREREFAADRAAARLTGSPTQLATALERLGETPTQPRQDARTTTEATGDDRTGPRHAAHVSSLCLLPHGFDPTRESSDTAGDVFEFHGDWLEGFTVETRTHPPLEERVRELGQLTERQESSRRL